MPTADADADVTLPSGQRLGIRHYGDPAGQPVFYFHGHPGSRLDFAMVDPNGLAADCSLHVIAVDRPGYGRSTPHPRTLLDWPTDVAALADQLSLPRFGVFGYSGGGPYALACAARLPDRLTGVVLAASMGPPDSPGQTTPPGWTLYSGARRPFRTPLIWAHGKASTLVPPRVGVAIARAALPASDRDALADPRIGATLMATWREAYAGGTEGAVSDAVIYQTPWPFRLDQVQQPVALWHGEADRNVPASVGRYLAEQLPHVTAHIQPAAGHVSILQNLPAMFDRLR